MIGRIYNVTFDNIAVAAAQDLFEVVAPSDGIVRLRSFEIGQSSDAGDAEAELLRLLIITGATTSGAGGASVTPTPKMLGQGAFGGTAERNNTTAATGGTEVTHRAVTFNVQAGAVWMPPEEEMIILVPSERGVINLPATPADSITMSGTLTIEEIG